MRLGEDVCPCWELGVAAWLGVVGRLVWEERGWVRRCLVLGTVAVVPGVGVAAVLVVAVVGGRAIALGPGRPPASRGSARATIRAQHQQVVDGEGVEGPEQVAGLLDRQLWPEGAPVGQQLGEAGQPVAPLVLELGPDFGELGVGGGRAEQDPEQRAGAGVDAGLGGGVQLELAVGVGLGDHRRDGGRWSGETWARAAPPATAARTTALNSSALLP